MSAMQDTPTTSTVELIERSAGRGDVWALAWAVLRLTEAIRYHAVETAFADKIDDSATQTVVGNGA